MLHLPRRGGDGLRDALQIRMADLPAGLLRSITWDQGTEMARHLTITRTLGAPVYFCDSHSPWQRGSNENMNGLLRDYFPMGTDLSVHSQQHLLAVEKGVPRSFRTADPYRIFSRKDGNSWQANTGISLPSFVRKPPGWWSRTHGLLRWLASSG